MTDNNSMFNIFRKNHFEVIIDDTDLTRLYINSIHLNKLSKTGTVSLYIDENNYNWVNSLQKNQSMTMQYVVYSPSCDIKFVVYDGDIVIDDVVYDCTALDESIMDRLFTAQIKFSLSDKHSVNS